MGPDYSGLCLRCKPRRWLRQQSSAAYNFRQSRVLGASDGVQGISHRPAEGKIVSGFALVREMTFAEQAKVFDDFLKARLTGRIVVNIHG